MDRLAFFSRRQALSRDSDSHARTDASFIGRDIQLLFFELSIREVRIWRRDTLPVVI